MLNRHAKRTASINTNRAKRSRVEPRTLIVAAAIYGGFGLVTWYFHALPLWAAVLMGAVLIAWHGSLQHETIHNHPFASRRLNALLGGVPLSLFIPYAIYRRSHLWHHRFGGRILTDPLVDPESFYLTHGSLAQSSAPVQFLRRANTTLLGRLILGPWIAIGTFLVGPARSLAAGEGREWRIWTTHGLAVAALLFWVVGICRINVLVYIACFVYPGQALTLVRSFAEHRANADPAQRTAVVEANPVLSLIFLYNNLHVVHHARPTLPWYALPAAWRRMQAEHGDAPARAAGMVYAGGYGEVLRRYFVRPVIEVEYPRGLAGEVPAHESATAAPGAIVTASATVIAGGTVIASGTATAG
jgi:fatty acid desaturase